MICSQKIVEESLESLKIWKYTRYSQRHLCDSGKHDLDSSGYPHDGSDEIRTRLI